MPSTKPPAFSVLGAHPALVGLIPLVAEVVWWICTKLIHRTADPADLKSLGLIEIASYPPALGRWSWTRGYDQALLGHFRTFLRDTAPFRRDDIDPMQAMQAWSITLASFFDHDLDGLLKPLGEQDPKHFVRYRYLLPVRLLGSATTLEDHCQQIDPQFVRICFWFRYTVACDPERRPLVQGQQAHLRAMFNDSALLFEDLEREGRIELQIDPQGRMRCMVAGEPDNTLLARQRHLSKQVRILLHAAAAGKPAQGLFKSDPTADAKRRARARESIENWLERLLKVVAPDAVCPRFVSRKRGRQKGSSFPEQLIHNDGAFRVIAVADASDESS